MTKILCISDTHNNSFDLPSADLCIHAGDFTMGGTELEIERAVEWLKSQEHKFKHGIIFTAGNHDWALEAPYAKYQFSMPERVQYFQEQGIEIEGIKIWLSPWSKWFRDWAFNIPLDKI